MVSAGVPRPSVTGMTQSERRETTRARLLEAAIDCIYEMGYARASTTEIARRAGVSRGAQVHHFPTKVELVSAALKYSMEQRIGEYWAMLERIPAGSERVNASIDLLWQVFDSKHGESWIEIAVAARQDDELRPYVHAVAESHRQAVQEMFERLFPPPPGAEGQPFYSAAPKFVVALYDGLILHRMMGYDDKPGRAGDVVDVMKLLAAMAFPVVYPAGSEAGG